MLVRKRRRIATSRGDMAVGPVLVRKDARELAALCVRLELAMRFDVRLLAGFCVAIQVRRNVAQNHVIERLLAQRRTAKDGG
jgi:hypothetical protein